MIISPTKTQQSFFRAADAVASLSSVRGMICPGQTCISSDATEMALWRFSDHALDVCLFYEQTASGACFLASREVFQSRG